MDEGGGSTAFSQSGTRNGTITGATWTSNAPYKPRVPATSALNNLLTNGYLDFTPPFTAATNTSGRWVDGTAAGSLTNDLSNWYLIIGAGSFVASFDSVNTYQGYKSIKLEELDATGRGRVVSAPFEGATTQDNVARYGIPCYPNRDYEITAAIKTVGANASSVRIQVLFYRPDGTGNGSVNSSFQAATQDFTPVTLRFTTGTATQYIVIKLDDNTASGGVHQTYFSKVRLTSIVQASTRTTRFGNLIPNGEFDVYPTFTAAQTTRQRYFDGSSGGSTENRSYYWAINGTNSTSSNISAQFDTAVFYSGVASMKLSTTGTNAACAVSNVLSSTQADVEAGAIRVLPSTTYSYRVRMLTTYVSGDSSDGAYTQFTERNASGASITSTITTKVKTTTGWTEYTGSFTTSSTTVWVTPIMFVVGNTGAATLQMSANFDSISLTRG